MTTVHKYHESGICRSETVLSQAQQFCESVCLVRYFTLCTTCILRLSRGTVDFGLNAVSALKLYYAYKEYPCSQFAVCGPWNLSHVNVRALGT